MGQVTGVRCGARFVSYPELFDAAARVARGFAEVGIEPGSADRIALLLRNDIAFIEATLGAAALGAVPVPINWHWKAEEVGYLLRDSEAKVLVVHDDLLADVAETIPAGVAVVAVGAAEKLAGAAGSSDSRRDLITNAHSYQQWHADFIPWDEAPERAPMSVIYTSGTTGTPKGVVRRPQAEQDAQRTQLMLEHVFHLGPEQRTVIPAPMYHTAPNVYSLAAAVRGMDMVIMSGFDAEAFLAIVERQRTTTVQMVPTMFVRLLALPEEVRARYDLSSLEWVVHAAAPCPPEVKSAMIEWLGPIVTEYYGCTETGACVFCTSEQWLAHPGTVGRPLEGANVAIFDTDGRKLPQGESGDVYMWLDAWPDFTYQGDEHKRAAAERDGLITCGDVGYLDADGFLYLNDRRSDMVISGGVNVYPAEIEACLITLDGVRDCAVFGIPDEQFGEVLAAHIEVDPHAGLEAADVRQHVGRKLARYKIPRVIEFSAALPREDSGKIFKRHLRDPYWAGMERRI
ncbi:MAG: AMP-binding protein [Solirubrobacteraceae bacterium]|nr:MAG: long-chain fatty acid--CoA ligase [Solirubrobacterales bacterium]